MIFLGAGASKYFDIDTLQDMSKDLIDKMTREGHGEVINDIVSACERFGLRPDFENIYTAIEGLAKPYEGVKASGPFAAYIASKGNLKIVEKPDFCQILKEFRKLVYDKCTIKKGMIEERGAIFGRLFKTVEEFQEERVVSSKTGNLGLRKVSIGDTIVTTNYDVAIELYHRHVKREIACGFRTTPDDFIKKLDFEEYGRHPTNKWLIKLHGSIWQFKTKERIIQTIGPPESSPLDISVGEQMMIYPVGEKPILKEPYYSFYSIFKEQPWSILIVIGHSFRDEPVNIAILERLVGAPASKLIVIDPEADSVIRNLQPPSKEVDQRVIRIPQPFENDARLFRRIKIAIRSSSYNDFKRRTRSFFKKIRQKDIRHD
jgi:hypothetical protein